ncbi:SGNH/GDSL hydrolase family protein [Massilia sp. DD77]|uniref:SGNH/GDSL hydrolase family protein n=1 Tax=Massilia sp. DD77 TaxID=3109349 RepID=UPI002FFDB156
MTSQASRASLSNDAASRGRRRVLAGLPALAGALAFPASPALAQSGRGQWYASWGCAPSGPPPSGSALTLNGQTLRLVVRTGIGAGRLRIRLSNEMGSAPLRIGAASIALRSSAATVYAGTSRALSFGGRPTITIPAGTPALSDPVDLSVGPFADLAVSLYLPGPVTVSTIHTNAYQANYLSSSGNHTASTSLPVQRTLGSWPFLAEVDSDRAAPVIVAAGDSLTDGIGSTTNTNRRWPDWLARRFQAELSGRGPFAVVNRGLSGNRLLLDDASMPLAGRDLLERFDRDVLATAGVRALAVLIGMNDILFSPASSPVPLEDMAGGYRQLVERAHARGIAVMGATLPPFGGNVYFNPRREAARQDINAWLRSSGAFDLLTDFDLVLRDPQAPERLRSSYDYGDHLHPNDAGYQAMAASVPLAQLGALAAE